MKRTQNLYETHTKHVFVHLNSLKSVYFAMSGRSKTSSKDWMVLNTSEPILFRACQGKDKRDLQSSFASLLHSVLDKRDLQSSFAIFASLLHSVFWNFELFWLFSFLAEVGYSFWTNGFSKDCFRPRHSHIEQRSHHEQKSSTFNCKDCQDGRVKLLKLSSCFQELLLWPCIQKGRGEQQHFGYAWCAPSELACMIF